MNGASVYCSRLTWSYSAAGSKKKKEKKKRKHKAKRKREIQSNPNALIIYSTFTITTIQFIYYSFFNFKLRATSIFGNHK